MRLRTYYNYPHIIQTSTTKHKNSCRRQHPATTWRVLCDDRRVLNESPESRVEVSGGHFDKIQAKPPCIFAAALWCFSPGFSRKAGKNQGSFALDLIEQSPGLFDPPGRAPVRRGHRQGVALTNYKTVEVQPAWRAYPRPSGSGISADTANRRAAGMLTASH